MVPIEFNAICFILELPKHHFAFTVIKEMLQLEEHARPKISKVIEDLEAACP
jgi:hypothetical protein